jgi:hypothetical protein
MSNDPGKITINDALGNNIASSTYLINNIFELFGSIFLKIQEVFTAIEGLLQRHVELRKSKSWKEFDERLREIIRDGFEGEKHELLGSVNLAEDVLFSKNFKSIKF